MGRVVLAAETLSAARAVHMSMALVRLSSSHALVVAIRAPILACLDPSRSPSILNGHRGKLYPWTGRCGPTTEVATSGECARYRMEALVTALVIMNLVHQDMLHFKHLKNVSGPIL